MIDHGKQNLLGVMIDAVDYDAAVARVIEGAEAQRPVGVSALAVHGVMEAVADPELRYRINQLELVTPDGQPVRWSLDLIHRTGLPDRCYGPTLTLKVCEEAAKRGLPVYLYGSEPEVVTRLKENLEERFPGLEVAGAEPSRFGRVSPKELDEIAERIVASGARIVFAGLGCPRQEVFAFEMKERLGLPVLAVGAAFDYHSGMRKEPPLWIQRAGIQWLWRLAEEPGRLWKRYLRTNPAFVVRVAMQRLGLSRPSPETVREPAAELGYA